jgi:hypothetical protein
MERIPINLLIRRFTGAAVLVSALAAAVLSSTESPQSSGGKQKAKTVKVQKRKNPAVPTVAGDSALFRAVRDSLARATADSLRRVHEIHLARLRDDSIKAAQLRVVPNEAFGTGERLVFDVNFGFVTAGEAVLAVNGMDSIAGRRCFRVEFTVNSLPSFSWIFRVEDHYLTFVDEQTIAPWKFEQHIREGNFHKDFVAEFDQRKKVARAEGKDYPTPQYVHDILSAFYFVRTVDFSGKNAGDMITMSNFYSDTTYDLAVKVLGRQELEIEAGTFRTIVVEPLVKEGGLFKSEGRIVIWLTDDERKMPVRVNTKVIIGSIDTELRSYSGLRGPVRARVK